WGWTEGDAFDRGVLGVWQPIGRVGEQNKPSPVVRKSKAAQVLERVWNVANRDNLRVASVHRDAHQRQETIEVISPFSVWRTNRRGIVRRTRELLRVAAVVIDSPYGAAIGARTQRPACERVAGVAPRHAQCGRTGTR